MAGIFSERSPAGAEAEHRHDVVGARRHLGQRVGRCGAAATRVCQRASVSQATSSAISTGEDSTVRAPACSQAALIPIASSPERTETRAELAGREHHRLRGAGELVDVVAEPRAVGELDGGEQRVLAGVPAVAGEVEHVDLGRQRGDPGGGRVVAAQHRAHRATPSSRAGDLLLAARDVRPGHETDAARPLPVAALARSSSQRVADGGMVSGRPTSPGSSDHGVPASAPEGVSTTRRSPSRSGERGRPAARRPRPSRARRAARRGAASASSRWAAAIVRSEVSPSRRSRRAASVAEVDDVAGRRR